MNQFSWWLTTLPLFRTHSDPEYKAIDTDRKLKLYGVCVWPNRDCHGAGILSDTPFEHPQYPGLP